MQARYEVGIDGIVLAWLDSMVMAASSCGEDKDGEVSFSGASLVRCLIANRCLTVDSVKCQ